MLLSDIDNCIDELDSTFSWYGFLDSPRAAAMVNLHFNMGMPTLKKFKKALAYMAIKDYDNAASEFYDSRWAKMVGDRAVEVCQQIRTGEYQ